MAADLSPIPVRDRPVPPSLDVNAIETVSEVLLRGEPVLHPAIADATEVVAYCVQRLADSLDDRGPSVLPSTLAAHSKASRPC